MADYLARRAKPVELCVDCETDRELVTKALTAARRLEKVSDGLSWIVATREALESNDEAWDAAFDARERESRLFRHHALVDARALRDIMVAKPRALAAPTPFRRGARPGG